MPKYTVIITRDITESTVIEVEALNTEAAYDEALTRLQDAVDTEWQTDDGSWNNSEVYVTDIMPDA